MEGLGFDLTILIWVTACIAFNVILWYAIKTVAFSIITKNATNTTIGEILTSFNKTSSIVKTINITIWIIIIATMVIFHGTKRYVPHHDMGAKTAINEVRKLEPPTSNVIETINNEGLEEKENLIEKEVKKDQKESAEDYNKFIEESLKGIN